MRLPLTTLCYVEHEGRYLMLHRTKKKEDINGGKWIGVGGHFEENESPDECMAREIREETGLTPTSWRARGVVTFISDDVYEYMHLFTVDAFSGDLIDCDEGDLAWIEKSRVLDLPTWEGDRIFLRLIAKEEPYFLLKLVYVKEKLTEAWLNGERLSLDD